MIIEIGSLAIASVALGVSVWSLRTVRRSSHRALVPASSTAPPMESPSQDERALIEREWLLTLFANAQNDLRWYKDRSSSVLQWTLVVFAALATAGATNTVLAPALVVVATLQGGYAIHAHFQLHTFGEKTRLRVRRLLPPETMPLFYPALSKRDPHHGSHLAINITLIFLGYLASLFAIVWP